MSELDSLIESYDSNAGSDFERVVHLRSIIWLTQDKDKATASKYFKMCEDIASQSLDSNTIIEVMFIGGVRDRKAKNFQSAKNKILKVLDYSERHLDTANIDRIHFHIGGVYFDLKEYERAIYHSLRARDYTPSSSIRMHYNITIRLTSIYRRIGMQGKVLDEWKWYFHNHEIDWLFLKSLTIGKISDEYLKRNQLDSALLYANHALVVAQKDSSNSMIHRAYGNQAFAYFLKGNINEAYRKGLKSYEYFDESRMKSNPLAYRTARKAIGGVFKTQLKYEAANDVYAEGLKSAKLSNNASEIQFFLEHLLELAIIDERSSDALEYSKQLSVVKEELKDQYNNQRILGIKTEYDLDKKDLEIKLLNSQNRLKDLEINKSKRNILFASLGLGLLGCISFLLYSSLRARKKSQSELVQKNNQISSALADKELLLKEIHHRVKNNLQIVSSLLGLQSEYIKDESALSAINEGRNRVRSMSLIHQNLYKENNLKGIKMNSYLEKLISGLFDTYNINEENIKLKLTIQDLELDVDTVVPLGLIANELVSNSLKHGFKIKKKGTVNVSLHEKGDFLELVVSDNGDGIDSKEISEDISSFGYQMIFAFKEKLNAELNIRNSHGTNVTLSIEEYKKT